MYCKFCGKPIADDAVYCSHCGKSQSGSLKPTHKEDEPKRIWLTITSLVASVISIIGYIIMSVLWHNRIMSYMDDDIFARLPPIEVLVPTEWVVIMCIATFIADLFMLLSWTKSKAKIGFNIVITILACLVTFVSLLAVFNPVAIK